MAKHEFDLLTENAFDFLDRAIDDFAKAPKYSVTNFYSAVELFLKARLIKEHWSLVVSKEPNRVKFESGDFSSVSFELACQRLEDIVQSPLPKGASKNFNSIRKHRNRMVHFYHRIDQAELAVEQLRAWYDLNRLLTIQWVEQFRKYGANVSKIEARLKGHREYLQAKFDDLKVEIAARLKKGSKFETCPSCKFKSSEFENVFEDLFESRCLVCDQLDKWLVLRCPKCKKDNRLHEGGDYSCGYCGGKLDEEGLVELLDDAIVTKDNYFEANTPANCSECEGFHTVASYREKFLCVRCLDLSEEVTQCGWCSDYSTGDMEGSYYNGCSACEGHAGWHAEE